MNHDVVTCDEAALSAASAPEPPRQRNLYACQQLERDSCSFLNAKHASEIRRADLAKPLQSKLKGMAFRPLCHCEAEHDDAVHALEAVAADKARIGGLLIDSVSKPRACILLFVEEFGAFDVTVLSWLEALDVRHRTFCRLHIFLTCVAVGLGRANVWGRSYTPEIHRHTVVLCRQTL